MKFNQTHNNVTTQMTTRCQYGCTCENRQCGVLVDKKKTFRYEKINSALHISAQDYIAVDCVNCRPINRRTTCETYDVNVNDRTVATSFFYLFFVDLFLLFEPPIDTLSGLPSPLPVLLALVCRPRTPLTDEDAFPVALVENVAVCLGSGVTNDL